MGRTLIPLPLFLAAGLALAVLPLPTPNHDTNVLILGGGVSGIIAARALHEHGVDRFLIVEARDELGGRMRSAPFGVEGRRATIELGANWIQGAGPTNPILGLARKHGLRTTESNFYTSIVTYDENGAVDYLDTVNKSVEAYINLTVAGGARVRKNQVDTTCRAGYSLVGMKPKTPQEMVAEYYVVGGVPPFPLFSDSGTAVAPPTQFDWQYAQTPEQTSWIASSWAHNFTYEVDQGGFSDNNLLSVDQRGFKHLIQAEADTFLSPTQMLLNATVRTIADSGHGVLVTLANGSSISADYAITTFSLGVLQNNDVLFEPPLPMWKQEAIQSMKMAAYTKIFLQFEDKFWFDTQFALYADKERGRYPIWQGLDLDGFLPGSGAISVTVTGDYSERIEALSDEQVQAEVLEVLRTMFPNITIPAPTAFFFPRWYSDPLYRGSYANWPASFVRPHHTNLRANVGRIWFAGEATSEKYFGFLHGAYFEGQDAGVRVARCVRGGSCQSLPFMESVPNANPYIEARSSLYSYLHDLLASIQSFRVEAGIYEYSLL